ncbi:MAG: LysM peptidoglycan-binding domain-containing protein [Flavobacteriales bacterium]|nr:LysM peptidoglycan-binding domain-containing protein [Flavobacteriales bacterium]
MLPLWAVLYCLAQNSSKPIKIGEEWFVIHTVKKGETLSKISREYQVPMEKIIRANPGVGKVIKAGEKLRIPSAPPRNLPSSEPIKTTSSPAPQEYREHIIKKGETLFGIARKYGLTIENLQALNPGLTEKIQEGQRIRIPLNSAGKISDNPTPTQRTVAEEQINKNRSELLLETEDEIESPDKTRPNPQPSDCIPKVEKNTFTVAVLLPFDGEATDTALRHTRIAWQFYCGLKAAAQLHVPRSAIIKVRVYDTGPPNALQLIHKLLSQGALQDADVIVGPLYASGFKPVAEYAQVRQIPVINPFGRSPTMPSDPPQIRMTPSQKFFAESLAEYVAARYQFGRVIFVNGAPGHDTSFYRQFLRATEATLKKMRPTAKVLYQVNSVQEIGPLLVASAENLIYYPSSREMAVNSFLNSLRTQHKNFPLTIMGDESWLSFTTADMDFFKGVQLRIPVQTFAARGDTLFEPFYKLFKETYHTEPDYYAFKAFDIFCFVVDILETYGHLGPKCLEKEKRRYLLQPIRLRSVPGTNTLENRGVAILTLIENDIYFETYGF